MYSVDNFEEPLVLLGFPPVDNLWKTLGLFSFYPHALFAIPLSYRKWSLKNRHESANLGADSDGFILAP